VAWYLDTSALVKLVIAESETRALEKWLRPRATVVSSDLARTELLRAVRRTHPTSMVRAREVLDAVALLTLSTPVCERAALLDPVVLRSPDAIHIAAAMQLGDELDGIVTYDDRLAQGCAVHGIAVIAPA
jgi:predicted nucleic acid-binding protein